jgi:hypothetical protein
VIGTKQARIWISHGILLLYFFLSATYGKRFVYLNINVGEFPIFITEIALMAVLGLRLPELKTGVFTIPRRYWMIVLAFVAFWLGRLAVSVAEGVLQEFGAIEVLRHTCIFYQCIWIFVPFLFSRRENFRFLGVAIAGIGFAQVLGWTGFLIMGQYSHGISKFFGYPVGNEVLLPLYLFSLVLFHSAWSFLYLISFGLLWLTQFVLYMKRNWVFSVFVFSLPALYFALPGKRLRTFVIAGLASLFGLGLAYATLEQVRGRGLAPLYHIGDGAAATEQRKEFSALTKGLLFLVDHVYQSTDLFSTDVSMKDVIFKGDLASDKIKPSIVLLNPVSMMAFRFHLWKQAWERFLERPVFGNGFGPRFAETQLNGLLAQVDYKWISGPHNSYLMILHRMGIVGFGLYLLVLLYPLWQWLIAGVRKPFSWIVMGAFASTSFFALFNVCLENPQGGVWYWFFLGLVLFDARERNRAKQAPPS